MLPLKTGLIGCGSFARGMHVPNMIASEYYTIHACCDLDEDAARAVSETAEAAYFTTDVNKIFNDPEIEVIVIATWHDSHAELTIKAAEAGKHILCEKPMGMNMAECRKIATAVRANNVKYTVGYNRGLSPFISKAVDLLTPENDKRMIYYRMQAPFPASHWTHNPAVGGGRFIGEGCHNFDVLCELVAAPPVAIYASGGIFLDPDVVKIPDSASVTISFADDSVATVLINSKGCADFPKESIEIYCNGKVICISDYIKMETFGFEPNCKTTLEAKTQNKGHIKEIEQLADAIINDKEPPSGIRQATRAACISYKVNESIATGKVIPISEEEYNL
ncbi:MAG: Gfo/Idh/MocA family oxidoreductase [Victivallaceae bacterium]|nr:Gfo/Idh/MocA family oxidoreductase [Victivallaceae bacterium]